MSYGRYGNVVYTAILEAPWYLEPWLLANKDKGSFMHLPPINEIQYKYDSELYQSVFFTHCSNCSVFNCDNFLLFIAWIEPNIKITTLLLITNVCCIIMLILCKLTVFSVVCNTMFLFHCLYLYMVLFYFDSIIT